VRDEAPYVEEWIAFHETVGVEHFYVYDNGSTDETVELLDRPNVTVIDWPGDLRQLEAYGDALSRFAQSRWLAFLDIDEFLFSVDYVPLPTVLRDYHDQPALGVCWATFGTSGVRHRPMRVLGSYHRRAARDNPAHRHVKSIVQPALVPVQIPADPHHFRCRAVDTTLRALDGPFAQTVTWERLRVNHYWSKSIWEAVAKERQPRADTGELRRGLTSDEYNQVEDRLIDPYIPLIDARSRRP
jgi:hypothetical protein